MLAHMRQAGLEFGIKNNAASFLGINIKHHKGEIEVTQPGLIDHAIVAMDLQHANPAKVPAPKAALGQDKDSIPYVGEFNYASVVGMLMYIANNTCAGIAFAMNQCACHMHRPTNKTCTISQTN
eukprot:2985795-Ditylum_brightwellii.AAC.1